MENPGIENITSFHEKLDKTLRKLKVIKEELVHINYQKIPPSVKNAARRKRIVDRNVTKGRATLAELEEAKQKLRKTISVAKKRAYHLFIKRGIDFLKNNDSKKAWKWIKTHSGRASQGRISGQVYVPNTTTVEGDPQKSLDIWAEHFGNLCQLPDKEIS